MSFQNAIIPEELAGRRLDQALAEVFPQYSRSRLKAWLLAGEILVDGEKRRPRDAVEGGESVTLNAAEPEPTRAAPEPMTLDVAWEDEHLLVINKPAGLVVHPGAGNPTSTLMNGLLAYDDGLATLPRAGIIHRLDKDTTGLLIIARTLESHTALTRMLADRDIDRHYQAVCMGVLTGGGTIDEPIGRHPVDRVRMAVHPNGKDAVTHYTVAERFRGHTRVDVKLETGRTHQIRVHFAFRRHPLVGDSVYGGRLALPAGASDELVQALRRFKRQALHAARLAFEHPITGEPVEITAERPADFDALLDVLREDAE